jgi:hypothetical protein
MFMFIAAPPESWGSFRALVGNEALGFTGIPLTTLAYHHAETYGYFAPLLEHL